MNTTHDAEARVRALIDVTHRLTALIEEENGLLRTRRPRDVAPLQAEKTRLAGVYADAIRDIAADRSTVAGADDRLIAELRDLTEIFEARASEQRALIEGARAASEGVVRAIATEVADDAGGYGASNDDAAAPIILSEQA